MSDVVGQPTRSGYRVGHASGEETIKRILAVAAAVALGSVSLASARAAPPTATPSPGYDARLQQQHAAQSYGAPVYEPTRRNYAPTHRRVGRIHDRMH